MVDDEDAEVVDVVVVDSVEGVVGRSGFGCWNDHVVPIMGCGVGVGTDVGGLLAPPPLEWDGESETAAGFEASSVPMVVVLR